MDLLAALRILVTDIWEGIVFWPVGIFQNWLKFVRNPTSIFSAPDVPGGDLFPIVLRPFANAVEMIFEPMSRSTDAVIRAVGKFLVSIVSTIKWPSDWNTRVIKQNTAASFTMGILTDVALQALTGPDELQAAITADMMVSRFGRFRKLWNIVTRWGEGAFKYLRDKVVKRLALLVVAVILAGAALGVVWVISKVGQRMLSSKWPTLPQDAPRRYEKRCRKRI